LKTRRFAQVDVFTATPYLGNALAVVVDGDGLSDEQMATFARWTNLAETTFLQTPDDSDADYKVRIFTPSREMPFAGHPTLGSCAAWLDSGGTPKANGKVIQQCNIGLVEIDYNGQVPAFVAPPTRIEAMEESTLNTICTMFNLDKNGYGRPLNCQAPNRCLHWIRRWLDGPNSAHSGLLVLPANTASKRHNPTMKCVCSHLQAA